MMSDPLARKVLPAMEVIPESNTAQKSQSAQKRRDGKRKARRAASTPVRPAKSTSQSWRMTASEAFLINTLPIVLYRAEADSEFSGPRRMGLGLAKAIGIKAIGFLVNRDLWPSRIHPDERERVLARMAACRAGDSFSIQYRVVCADDSERVFLDQGSAIAGRNGKVEIRGVCLDVTHRNEMERHLLWAQRLETMSRFIDNLAHDFLNTLSVTIWNLDGLKLAVDARGAEGLNLDRLGTALTGASTSAEMFRELTTFTRHLPRKARVVKPAALIEGLTQLFQLLIGEDGTLEVDIPDGLWPICADEGQIESSLIALVRHARDRMPESRWLRIHGANIALAKSTAGLAAGEYLAFTICDGAIRGEELERAFEEGGLPTDLTGAEMLFLRLVHSAAADWGGQLAIGNIPGAPLRLMLPRGQAST
jgi:signal transduction histidine kinase